MPLLILPCHLVTIHFMPLSYMSFSPTFIHSIPKQMHGDKNVRVVYVLYTLTHTNFSYRYHNSNRNCTFTTHVLGEFTLSFILFSPQNIHSPFDVSIKPHKHTTKKDSLNFSNAFLLHSCFENALVRSCVKYVCRILK